MYSPRGTPLDFSCRRTSIHWHGFRQYKNFKVRSPPPPCSAVVISDPYEQNDGVNGVTECPLAPGDTKTYTFIAEQYGASLPAFGFPLCSPLDAKVPHGTIHITGMCALSGRDPLADPSSAQYGDGVWGAIQINGPATAEVRVDLRLCRRLL